MVQGNQVRGAAIAAIAMTFIAPPLMAQGAQPAQADAVRTRVLAWPAGDRLYVATNADVRYVPGQAAKMVITGPSSAIQDIVVEHGVIERRHAGWHWRWWGSWDWGDWRPSRRVQIVVTAPHVERAGVSGSGHLDLGRLVQDRLEASVSGSGALDVSGQFKSLGLGVSGSGGGRLNQVSATDMSASISGSGWIRAAGAATSLHLSISGSGHADLGGLVAENVSANLSGSGSARLSPKRAADLAVAGSGSIRLLTEPAHLSTHRAGSGSIISPGGVS